MKIVIINGPNLNLLGERDSTQYGRLNLDDINLKIEEEFPETDFFFFQSNIEGEIINKIQMSTTVFDGMIINPGGYAHTSVAIRDALETCSIPKIEVHLSNIASREEFRHNMITASVCNGYIAGLKELSYISAVFALKKIINEKP
ncbi:MAG TPA: type II 3-dehydroquinate dehydratase [Ignavibacteriaceae bacterium]|jgi:3-dehydroquinate dehydratase-2|nr:type II 3-dehydroquinate dehydratase [Ignavibacteriaceae bacterium]